MLTLDNLVRQGRLPRMFGNDILADLSSLRPEAQEQAVARLAETDLGKVRNHDGYFVGILRSTKRPRGTAKKRGDKVVDSCEDATPQMVAEIIKLHGAGMGRKKIARCIDRATCKMVNAVLAAHADESVIINIGSNTKAHRAAPVQAAAAASTGAGGSGSLSCGDVQSEARNRDAG